MNKKMLIIGLLAVFILISISFVSSAETNTDVDMKESPLWRIRTKQAITERISNIVENIKTKLFGERAFFSPLKTLFNMNPNPNNVATTHRPDCTCYKVFGCMYGYITEEMDCYIDK